MSLPSPKRALLSTTHLVLVLDAGMSLMVWDQHGILEREILLYRRLRPFLGDLTIVSRGGSEEAAFASHLPDCQLVFNRFGMSRRWYHWWISLALGGQLRLSHAPIIVKTNQMPGAGLPRRLARFARGRFLVRTGYLHHDFAVRLHGEHSQQAREAQELERSIYAAADMAQVTSLDAQQLLIAAYGLSESRVRVIPNFVDTSTFRPALQTRPPGRRVALVGRLMPQKNFLAAISALEGLDAEIMVVGEGPEEDEMRRLAQRCNVRVSFLGRRPHQELPELLAGCDLFLQPSHFEGHPKTLIEAMACGMPVIAGDSPGIRNVVEHGVTGLLCRHDASSIRASLLQVFENRPLGERLGRQARDWAEANVSLDRVVDMELDLLSHLAGQCAA
ncbi:MAG: glycosyltransferase family 4 protein [Rhodospirillales bacterium]|nr:glycosyltransferase family 4 protein [Rhodospirillales bacterium]